MHTHTNLNAFSSCRDFTDQLQFKKIKKPLYLRKKSIHPYRIIKQKKMFMLTTTVF